MFAPTSFASTRSRRVSSWMRSAFTRCGMRGPSCARLTATAGQSSSIGQHASRFARPCDGDLALMDDRSIAKPRRPGRASSTQARPRRAHGQSRASRSAGALILALAAGAAVPPASASGRQIPSGSVAGLQSVRVNGVELHYVERGSGEPIVFVHGALADYREWAPVIDHLSGRFRTIAYSRRYDYPNENPVQRGPYSALVDAHDLSALIRKLGPGPVHVVGVSYGALTALLVALEHPELVRTLTIVEPPLLRWLPELPGGRAELDRVSKALLTPAAAAFRAGDRERALRVTMAFFAGDDAISRFPPETVRALRANLREWEAITTSADGFPMVPRAAVKRLGVPVLMISGERTFSFLKITDAELERLLPRVHRVIVENATHQVCSEQPQACAAAIRAHVSGN